MTLPLTHPRTAAAWAVHVALALAGPGPSPAQIGPSHWHPDDRVLIGDFSRVEAMTRSPTRVYVATSGGLVVYDDLLRAFELPLTREDGWPEAPVRALAFDERDGTLWLATADGRLLQLHPEARRFHGEVRLGEAVDEILPAEPAGSDLFVRARGRWLRLDVFLRDTRPADPAEVAAEAERSPDRRRRAELLRDPGFQSIAPFLGGVARGPSAAVVDVVPGRAGDIYWVGTAGRFVVEYDHLTRGWTPLAYGVLGRGAAAVAGGADEVWFLPAESTGGRFGVARANGDLQTWWQWPADSVPDAPREPLGAAVLADGVLWTGGAAGLWRYAGEDEGWRAVSGAPGARAVTALAPTAEGDVWVGTRRGAVLLSRAGEPLGRELLSGRRIESLAWSAGRLWLGTRAGLFVADGAGASSPVTGPGPLRGPVGALAAVEEGEGTELYAGLGDEVWRLDGGGWSRVEAIGPLGAPVTALAVRDGVVWAGGPEGVVLWDPAASEIRRYTFAAGDLPMDVGRRGVAALLPIGPRAVWVATPAGALRLEAE